MASRDDVVILNDFGDATLKSRTSSTGKQRTTVSYKAQAIAHNFDPKLAGKVVADAIAATLKMKVQQIATVASSATLRARKVAAKAFAVGEPWATKRYGGGKLGAMAPNQSDRAYNDSGRFAAGIAVGPKSDGWVVNVPANRLSVADIGELGVMKAFDKLRELVPEFADPKRLMDDLTVRGAVKQSVANMIQIARANAAKSRDQFVSEVISSGARLLSAALKFGT